MGLRGLWVYFNCVEVSFTSFRILVDHIQSITQIVESLRIAVVIVDCQSVGSNGIIVVTLAAKSITKVVVDF